MNNENKWQEPENKWEMPGVVNPTLSNVNFPKPCGTILSWLLYQRMWELVPDKLGEVISKSGGHSL